jgi:hypothetical protein
MFKLCQWIDHGHDYELLSHNSVNPSGLERLEVKGSMPDALAM